MRTFTSITGSSCANVAADGRYQSRTAATGAMPATPAANAITGDCDGRDEARLSAFPDCLLYDE
ncbi:MAG: hypothetical protein KF770_28540 [Anaerolineae bacterium]|nr:hypothetical protein [Anaerolineae bacterium]